MRTRTFGWKLGVGFAAVLSLTVVIGLVAALALDRVVGAKDALIAKSSEVLSEAEHLRTLAAGKVAAVRGFLLTGQQAHAARVAALHDDLTATIRTLRARLYVPEALTALQAVETRAREHAEAVDALLAAYRSEGGADAVQAQFQSEVLPRYEALLQALEGFVRLESQALAAQTIETSSLATTASRAVVILALVCVLVAAGIGTLLVRQLNRQVGASVQQVRSSSAELQTAATQQAAGAREQASAMGEISTTIGELLTTARQISESAEHVARMAEDTSGSSQGGTAAVEGARTAVERIRSQVGVIVDHMLDLGRKSQRIGGILELINELAEQTNILAVNATIEAADAGDAGRRFAVVGEEIRKLADRVGGSTREIRHLIDEMRAAVNTTVMATEAGAKTVESGVDRFAEVAAAFERIGEHVATTTQVSRETEVSTGQTQQTAGELARLSDALARLVHAGAAG